MDGLDRVEGADAVAGEPSEIEVRAQLSRILRSDEFANAPSLTRFLTYIVDRALAGKASELKEFTLGVDVFERGDAFDPKADTIVRVQARRLRSKLLAYYGSTGTEDTVVIELSKGRYVPEFVRRAPRLRPFEIVTPAVALLRRPSGESPASHRAMEDGHVLSAAPDSQDRGPGKPRWGGPTSRSYLLTASAVGVAFAIAAGALRLIGSRSAGVTLPSEYEQITDFTDSATAPALSQDGHMVAFIRGGEAFLSHGQIYVKTLPNGPALRLTNTENRKFAPTFAPDGRVAYSELSRTADVASWDTWTVPASGGEPTRLLPNATGLVWLDSLQVMFSAFKGKGGHLGIVTATEARAAERDVYFPAHERGMAHYSYPSPDRKAVLVVEMDRAGTFQSCRLVPFDGRSPGREVGPRGNCRFAAWSPDGTWMYFNADVAGHSHLWRQRTADGPPQQITFGPTQEEGVALAPDGRSLITSIGVRQSAIWIHDATGERPVSSEGFAYKPQLSHDGRHLYYLFRESAAASANELRTMDLVTGKVDVLLPGLRVEDNDLEAPIYDISRDETEAVFASTDRDGTSRIWLARLDRRTGPREIARDGDYPSFGAGDDVFFVTLGKDTSYFTRIRRDGSGRERVSDLSPIHNRGGISPDGEWAALYSPALSRDALPGTVAVPIRGGRGRRICSGLCRAWWSDDGRFFFVSVYDESSPERTLIIPLKPGMPVPDFPESGLNLVQNQSAIPGTRTVEYFDVAAAADPSTYVFVKTELRRNLYRVPLH